MNNNLLFRKKHELWLILKYSSLPIKDGALSNALRNFSEVAFRHLKWLGEATVQEIQEYDYTHEEGCSGQLPVMFDFEKDAIEIPVQDGRALIAGCQKKLQEMLECYDTAKPLQKRLAGDDSYFLFRLERIMGVHDHIDVGDTFFGGNAPIEQILGISGAELERLKTSLLQQQTKEYRSVAMHLYALVHTAKTQLSDIFYDQMIESSFHQFHYARMLASMGVVQVPPTVEKSAYQIGDMATFIKNAIHDEEQEIHHTKMLQESITNEDFRRLSDFILNQEDHHVRMLKMGLDLLNHKAS